MKNLLSILSPLSSSFRFSEYCYAWTTRTKEKKNNEQGDQVQKMNLD